jgi:hypothetical protein
MLDIFEGLGDILSGAREMNIGVFGEVPPPPLVSSYHPTKRREPSKHRRAVLQIISTLDS